MWGVIKFVIQIDASQTCIVSIIIKPSIVSIGVAFVITQVDKGMGDKCRIIYKWVNVRSAIWDVTASNGTTSGASLGIGWTQIYINCVGTSTILGLFEFNANVVDIECERALEVVLRDASRIGTDIANMSASKVDDGDSRYTSIISCRVAATIVHNKTVITTSVRVERAWDTDEGVWMVGLEGAMEVEENKDKEPMVQQIESGKIKG